MAEPINLNKARKTKTRAENKAHAALNRVKFGLTKAQKVRIKAEDQRASHALDQNKRET